MIVSIAIAVLPVWRSPMISSRWPRPIGIIESIAFRPVCIGSFTGWRWTTPGRLELGRAHLGRSRRRPCRRAGCPSGSTMRPSSASPTGISSSWLGALDRVALDDLLPVAEQHGADVVGLEVQREARHVVRAARASRTPCSSRGRGCGRCRRATERTVPTSVSSAPPASRPSMRLLEDAGDLVGLDLHAIASGVSLTAAGYARATCLRSRSSRCGWRRRGSSCRRARRGRRGRRGRRCS